MADLVTHEQVALRAGLPLPLSATHAAAITEALSDAYAEVAAHIEQPPIPATFTQLHAAQDGNGGWLLDQEPVVSVVSATPETDPLTGAPTGLYTVVYTAGLDPDSDPHYRMLLGRYVAWAAADNRMVRRLAQQIPGTRITTSANVEGQGATYEQAGGAAGSGAAGAPPALESLDGYRRLTVYQRPGIAPHPMETDRPWWS